MDVSPDTRLSFSELLHIIADPLDIEVYYQPPEDTTMSFPCLVYELRDIQKRSADNGAYTLLKRYEVTFIRHDPDSPIINILAGLPYSSFSRHFTTSDLNHDVFVIYH